LRRGGNDIVQRRKCLAIIAKGDVCILIYINGEMEGRLMG